MRPTKSNFSLLRIGSACLTLLALSSQGLAAETRDCRSIEDDAERLACYDNLSSPPSPPSSPAEAAIKRVDVPAAPTDEPTVAEAPPASGPAVLDDSVGKERIADRKGEEELIVSGHVTSCREDGSGKYRFYFDNGQIWVQKDNKRVTWGECSFDVTIEKDFFGYKMLPKGEKRSIRISRIK